MPEATDTMIRRIILIAAFAGLIAYAAATRDRAVFFIGAGVLYLVGVLWSCFDPDPTQFKFKFPLVTVSLPPWFARLIHVAIATFLITWGVMEAWTKGWP